MNVNICFFNDNSYREVGFLWVLYVGSGKFFLNNIVYYVYDLYVICLFVLFCIFYYLNMILVLLLVMGVMIGKYVCVWI